jgi:pyrroline-5-carboxylate reductase|tara:strand:+ start:88 stop:210 length:123 start_codon:yes stop_codon:yes gene_type:complete
MDSKFGVKTTLSNTALLDELKIIILSVKPNVMDEVLKEIA